MPVRKQKVRIDQKIAEKAIYIDFEGNAKLSPTFLGALYLDTLTGKPVFKQYIHEEVFRSAGQSTSRCNSKSMQDAFESLVKVAEKENRLFFAWSGHEKIEIEKFLHNEALKKRVLSRLFDCKAIAKRWKSQFYSDLPFEQVWGRGQHRLSEYMNLVGYPVPVLAGPGNAGKNLKYVRAQLLKRNGNYLDLTPVTQRKWQNVVNHNYHDCRGMRAVIKKAIGELGSSVFKKPVSEVLS